MDKALWQCNLLTHVTHSQNYTYKQPYTVIWPTTTPVPVPDTNQPQWGSLLVCTQGLGMTNILDKSRIEEARLNNNT